MPGPIELARAARARPRRGSPALAVLFTSGYTENAIIHHGRLDEGVNLLSKPYGRDELAHKIRSVLAAAKRPQAQPAARSDGATMPTANRALTILVVEDEPLIRLATIDQLETLGHAVVGVGTAQDALGLLDGRKDVDVLLTDIGLPGMDGRALAVEARRRNPALRIVIATGRSSPADGGEPALAGTIHLSKPYQVEDLRRALEQSQGQV